MNFLRNIMELASLVAREKHISESAVKRDYAKEHFLRV